MVGSIVSGQLSNVLFTVKLNANQFVYVSVVPIKVYLHQHKQQLQITKWNQLRRAKFLFWVKLAAQQSATHKFVFSII